MEGTRRRKGRTLVMFKEAARLFICPSSSPSLQDQGMLVCDCAMRLAADAIGKGSLLKGGKAKKGRQDDYVEVYNKENEGPRREVIAALALVTTSPNNR